MHADAGAGACPPEQLPHDQLLCTGVLLGVVELMRARGLLGDRAAAAAPGLGSPAVQPSPAGAAGCPVGAAGRPGTS